MAAAKGDPPPDASAVDSDPLFGDWLDEQEQELLNREVADSQLGLPHKHHRCMRDIHPAAHEMGGSDVIGHDLMEVDNHPLSVPSWQLELEFPSSESDQPHVEKQRPAKSKASPCVT